MESPNIPESKALVVPHNPDWQRAFAVEAAATGAALGDNVVAIHHIGSTAVPDILAKPVIDLLVEVAGLQEVDARSEAMVALGYEAMGEYGVRGRRYFRKVDVRGARTHHVHIFVAGCDHVVRHLAFRDYLRANPEVARAYSHLKAELAKDGSTSRNAYPDGKAEFMERTERQAVHWYRQRR